MARATLRLVALLCGPFLAQSATAAEHGAPSCLPIEAGDDGSPVIRARINGAGPFAFILDTAASGTTIDPARTAALALPRDADSEEAQGMGGAITVSFHRVAAFEAGPVRRHDIVIASLPAPDFDSHDIAGLAGVDLFPNRLVIWSPERRCVDVQASGSRLPDGVWRAVDARWLRPWKIMLPIRIGRISGWALLDTGAQYTTLNPAFAKRIGLQDAALRPGGSITGIDGHELPLGEGEVRDVAIGPWHWNARHVRVGALPLFSRIDGAGDYLAILGVDWLASKGFAIDYGHQSLWLRESGAR
ncbi:MAG: hypothetical protein C0520_08545 [Sphingopyxis sp.]|nr:hypothetical protein [Sphingopyxis sp.]